MRFPINSSGTARAMVPSRMIFERSEAVPVEACFPRFAYLSWFPEPPATLWVPGDAAGPAGTPPTALPTVENEPVLLASVPPPPSCASAPIANATTRKAAAAPSHERQRTRRRHSGPNRASPNAPIDNLNAVGALATAPETGWPGEARFNHNAFQWQASPQARQG